MSSNKQKQTHCALRSHDHIFIKILLNVLNDKLLFFRRTFVLALCFFSTVQFDVHVKVRHLSSKGKPTKKK